MSNKAQQGLIEHITEAIEFQRSLAVEYPRYDLSILLNNLRLHGVIVSQEHIDLIKVHFFILANDIEVDLAKMDYATLLDHSYKLMRQALIRTYTRPFADQYLASAHRTKFSDELKRKSIDFFFKFNEDLLNTSSSRDFL